MRSIVIMLSVALGLFAGLAVLSLYKGMMKSRVRTVIDAEIGHLQLHDSIFIKDMEPKFIIEEGKKILDNSGLKLISAEDLDDAAKKIVGAIK